ncbi:MAG: anti-sigma factor [Gaiellaceae bacterium]
MDIVAGGGARASSNGIAVATPAVAARREWQPERYEIPRQRLSGATLATLAALAGLTAIALGLLAFTASIRDRDSAGAASLPAPKTAQAISLLSKPTTERLPFGGTDKWLTLAVGSNGRGLLVIDGVRVAPVGRTYQAWVVTRSAGAEPLPAAVFSGIEGVVPLTARVQPGFMVGITIEKPGGAPAPTKSFQLAVDRPGRS